MNDIHGLVHPHVLAVVKMRAPDRTEVSDAQSLRDDLELDSLDLAQIAESLETALGWPVFQGVAIAAFRTVGDFCEACARPRR